MEIYWSTQEVYSIRLAMIQVTLENGSESATKLVRESMPLLRVFCSSWTFHSEEIHQTISDNSGMFLFVTWQRTISPRCINSRSHSQDDRMVGFAEEELLRILQGRPWSRWVEEWVGDFVDRGINRKQRNILAAHPTGHCNHPDKWHTQQK